jgi:tripartite ATP-independent transporter DctM subunit
MEWWLILIVIFCCMVFLFLIGVPVAFAFLLINIVGFYIFGGGEAGVRQLILSLYASVTKFTILPLPLFILMGEVMFQSGIARNMMDALDKWLGRLPGRLSLLAVVGGSLFGTLSGSSMAGAAMLGSVLVPEMEKRGYKSQMSIGPILGSGGLAIMIPPSILGVLLAAVGLFSVGDFLIAIIIPGLLMALCYGSYIILRSLIQPHLAPTYDVAHVSLKEKLSLTLKYILPLGAIVFLVVGLIFLGVATPSESAALGAVGCFVLAFIYRGFKWEIVRKSLTQTISISAMMLMIFCGSGAFSQILALIGATQGLVEMAANLPLPPYYVLIAMLIVLLVMGTFMESMTIIMITLPIYMPIIKALGFSPLWFGAIMLLSLEMGITTPPFGLVLFVVKGVAPKYVTMMDVYKAGIPFLLCDLVVIILLLAFPALALWLPGLIS